MYFEFSKDNFGETVLFRLVYMPTRLLYFVFYLYAIKRLLLNKKYLLFSVSVLLFIGLHEVIIPMYDWLIYKCTFLPSGIRQNAEESMSYFPRQSFSLALYTIATFCGFGYFIKTLNDEIKFRKLKEAHLQLELDNLKAHLQPHFFFNTLNNIYSLVVQKSGLAAPALDRLSELMRYIIYDCQKEKVPLQKEVTFIQNYIALEKIRHKNADISFHLQGNTNEISIEPLLFIPIIENAFKHGVNQNLSNSWVHIVFIIFDDEIVLEVKNNKPLKNQYKAYLEKGVGLQNVKKRLDLLYSGKHTLSINETDDVFEVNLNVSTK
jgi:LytS/YehU family sensor histidine kinase